MIRSKANILVYRQNSVRFVRETAGQTKDIGE
jgi:hypothetical protein